MFDGEVPKDGIFKNTSAFSIVGNDKLCGGIEALKLPLCSTKDLKRKRTLSHGVMILVIVLPIVSTLLSLALILFWLRRSRQQPPSALPLQNQYLQLSYRQLHQATNGFSSANLIGQGRYGFVYRAVLSSSEQIVAVKVLNLEEHGGNRSFIAECEALKNIRHRNLVKIITSVSSVDFKGNDFKALVFEFMENGSLETWLHPGILEQEDSKNLNFTQRLNVAIDIASALDYLHHQCDVGIIHCDLKPSNVLLDKDLCAHVSDFGLTKVLASKDVCDDQQSSSIAIRGTIGYVAPEYGMCQKVSTQGDMFSYGVLLLEMFTGRRPTSVFDDNITLHSYTKVHLPDLVKAVVDPRIIREEEGTNQGFTGQCKIANMSKLEASLAYVLQIGVSCSAKLPNERMNARDVLAELIKIRDSFLKG